MSGMIIACFYLFIIGLSFSETLLGSFGNCTTSEVHQHAQHSPDTPRAAADVISCCHDQSKEPLAISCSKPTQLPRPQGIMGHQRMFPLPHQLLGRSSGSDLTQFRPDYNANIGGNKEPFLHSGLLAKGGKRRGGGLRKGLG